MEADKKPRKRQKRKAVDESGDADSEPSPKKSRSGPTVSFEDIPQGGDRAPKKRKESEKKAPSKAKGKGKAKEQDEEGSDDGWGGVGKDDANLEAHSK